MNRKGFAGIAKYSLLVLAFAAILSFAVLNLSAVFAVHTVTVSVSPSVVGGGQTDTFTVTVNNSVPTPDNVSEFRIEYQVGNFAEFTDVTCLPKEGWNGPYTVQITNDGLACLYIASSSANEIHGGDSSDFQFTATTPDTECCRTLNFEVRGAGFDWEPKTADVCVDTTPPVTTKTYGNPHFPEDINDGAPYPHYISTETPITLDATDDAGPHDSGIQDIFWRVTQVDDSFCQSQDACSGATGSGDFTPVDSDSAQFEIGEQSCHLIEFYSVDGVGNQEPVNSQCVFVDNTPPIATKEIGQPSVILDGSGPILQAATTPCPGSQQVVITFEDLTGSGTLPTNYANLTWGVWKYFDTVQPPYAPHSGVERIFTDLSGNSYIVFPQPVTFDGAWFAGFSPVGTPTTVQFQGYLNGSLVGTSGTLAVNENSTWLPANFPSQVDTVFVISNAAQFYVMDDVTYTNGTSCGGGGGTGGNAEGALVTTETPITFTCTDQQPHPVDHSSLCFKVSLRDDDKKTALTGKYCDQFDGRLNDDGYCCVPAEESPFDFHFLESSNHSIDYYCMDALGNTGTLLHENDTVFTPPTTEKILGEPKHECTQDEQEKFYGDIQSTDGCFFITPDTDITLKCTGDTEHEGMTQLFYRYYLAGHDPPQYTEVDAEGDSNVAQATFNIPEESAHVLQWYCQEGIATGEVHTELDNVDNTPPVTTKTYGEPFFTANKDDETFNWISNATPITLTAVDAKSDHSTTEYKVTLLNVSADDCHEDCELQDRDLASWKEGDGSGFLTYNGPFTIPEESCHLIQYYSTDILGNREELKHQCVFVDTTPPVLNKTVMDPKTMWDGKDSVFYPEITKMCWAGTPPVNTSGNETGNQTGNITLAASIPSPNSIDCWKVTMNTEISLKCADQGPHPSDHSKVCIKVGVDGDDWTEKYCGDRGAEFNETGDGFCCLAGEKTDFTFKEETEHNLQAYCVDAVGNKGPIDEEKFRVTGTKFELPLCKKWNLISVPFVLLDSDPSAIFNQTQGVQSVWAYDSVNGTWLVFTPGSGPDTLTSIDPGWGYWVLEMNKSETLTLGGSLFNTQQVPPSKPLVEGWNLIGYYGTSPSDQVFCGLNSLVDTQEGFPRWSSLWTYSNPNCEDKMDSMQTWSGLNACDTMNIGKGYWVEMGKADLYAPASTCVWNSDFQCIGGAS